MLNVKPLWLVALVGLTLAGCSKEELRIQTAADVNRPNVRIGIMTGSTAEPLAKQQFPAARVDTFDDIVDAIAALKANQVDAVITAYPQALQLTKRNTDLVVIPERLDYEPTAAAVRQGDTAIVNEVNALVAELRADGTLADMEKRWFKPDLSPYIVPEIPTFTEGEPLKIGVAATREPASFADASGEISGFDGELARRLGARLRRPLVFSDMKFMALIPALQSSKIDIIMTGMSATDERRKSVDFSDTYFDNALMLVTRKAAVAAEQAGPKLRSSTDVQNKRIAVGSGSAHEQFVAREWPNAQAQAYDSTTDMLLAVRTGKVDAGLLDAEIVIAQVADDPTMAMFGEPLLPFSLGVGFNKDSTSLRDQFNEFLRGIEADGTLADMRARWIDKRERTPPQLPPPPSGQPLVVGTTTGGLPFEAVVDGQLVGFDIELMQRFGNHIGRPIDFQRLLFSSLVASVATGKVDAIAASIFITPEREQRIDFSAPYHTTTSRLFARRADIADESAPAVTVTSKPSFWQSTVNSFESNILTERRYLLLWDGLKTTVVISLLATLFGTAIGAVVCGMRLSSQRLLNIPAKGFIGLLRGIPVLVVLMLTFYVVFASVDISPILVAVIAFGLNFGAYAAEIFRSGIQSIDRGQTEAGLAIGFTRLQTFVHIVLPQMVRRVFPVYKGEFISLIKMTSIVGYIAVQDLTKASDIIRSRTFDAFFPLILVAVLYFAIAWALVRLLDVVEYRLDPRSRKRVAGESR